MGKRWKNVKRYSRCLLILFLLFAIYPVSTIAAETDSKAAKSEEPETIRVGWHEDAYHITGENGQRSGYGYEYEQAAAAYTGWKYEYVEGGWNELLEMLGNGEIDMIKSGVQETQFSEWEEKHNLKTQHVYTETFEDGINKASNQEFDGVISTETPQWVEFGMSAIATTGGSNIYYGINKNRPDLKEKLDNAMRKMENEKPFYADELYKKYLSAASSPVLSSEEKDCYPG